MAQEEELQLWQTVEPVEFAPRLAARSEAQSLLIASRQGAGFPVAAGQLAHAIKSRATHVLLDYSKTACAIRYQIDGAWEQLPPLDRETGDAMLYCLKQLCLLNPADRRGAQTGGCDVKIAKDKFRLDIQSRGIPTGERVLMRIESEKLPFDRMTDLGMRDKMLETFKSKLDETGNIVLISTPKGEGLTTTWKIAMETADRFVRDFQSIEEETSPELEVININSSYFGGKSGTTQLELVNRITLKEPDVLIFPELPEDDVFTVAIGEVERLNTQIYTRTVADNAIQAIAKLVAKYPKHAAEISKHIGAVLCQRLVRRLCDNCKIGFEPQPKLLKQLGIPQGRVGVLYQPFIPPPVEQQVDENGRPAPIIPCHVCDGRGYFGRVAVFELLIPGPKFKAALAKTRDLNQLAQIAKSEGFRGIQAEAILTVARGMTSLDELKRAFSKK